MKKYNLRNIMNQAWKIFRKLRNSFSEALRMAWQNAKAIQTAKEKAAVNEECHTWYAWKKRGFEVIHESKAVFKVTVFDPDTKKGTRTLSYFGRSQVQAI